MKESSKVVGDRENTQKSAHSYSLTMNNLKRKFKKIMPFMLAWKRIKCLGINQSHEGLIQWKLQNIAEEIKEDKDRNTFFLCMNWKT